jgi:hypothetical protein
VDKIVKSNLIAYAAVVAVPAAISVYFNVRTKMDVARINQSTKEVYARLNQTIDKIHNETR